MQCVVRGIEILQDTSGKKYSNYICVRSRSLTCSIENASAWLLHVDGKVFFSIFVICLSAFAVLNATTCSTLHCGEREKLKHFLARNVVFATIPRFFLFECRWRKDETRSKRCKRKENSNRESKFMLITLSRTCLILIYIISEFSCETLISFNVNNRQGAQHIYMRIVLQIIQNYGNSYFKCL